MVQSAPFDLAGCLMRPCSLSARLALRVAAHLCPSRLLPLLLSAALTACGGGGGDSAPPPDPATLVRLGNVQASGVNQRIYEGERLQDVSISADVSGDLNRLNGQTLYVVVEDPSQLFGSTPRVLISGNGIGNRVDLMALSSSGRAGSYRSPLRLLVCLDAACTRPINGSPVSIPLSIDVLPKLGFAPTSPVVIELVFGVTPEARNIGIRLPEGMSDFEIDHPPTQQYYSAVRGAAPGASVDLTPTLLPVGSFTTTLTVHGYASLSGGLSFQSATLPVELRVAATPGVNGFFQPARLNLQTYRGAGLNSPVGGQQIAYFVAADGTRYTEVSRIVYREPDGSGNASAGGLEWLQAGVSVVGPVPQPVYVSAGPAACVSNDGGRTIRCLSDGRYEALVYLRTAAGQEYPDPLPVSMTVTF